MRTLQTSSRPTASSRIGNHPAILRILFTSVALPILDPIYILSVSILNGVCPPYIMANKADAGVEGYVNVTYNVNGVAASTTGLGFIEGGSYGWDTFDSHNEDPPFPGQAYVEAVGSIEGEEADFIAYPPLESFASESFTGSLVVQRGTINLEEASHYLTWSLGGDLANDTNADISINGVNARSTHRLDLGTLTGSYREGEHSTASWTISVTYNQPLGGGVPQVETVGATDVTYTSATLEGQISNDATDCDCYFTYWPEGGVPYTVGSASGIDGPQTFTATISGLQPDTIYSYQAHASNAAGSASGGIETFVASDSPAVVPDGVPDILRILNCYAQTQEYMGLSWELWHIGGACEGIDAWDAPLEYPNVMKPAVISTVDEVKLQRDARPRGYEGPIFLELAFVHGPEWPAGSTGHQPKAANYLKVSMPSEARLGHGGSLVTLQQVSADPCMSYPIFDLRKVIENGSVDPWTTSINYSLKVGIVPLADWVQKKVVLEEPYAVLELRTDKVSIADYDNDKVVDANDYAVWVRDYGKVGDSASDIASMNDGTLTLGLPDGRVDQNDLLAFEQERQRWPAVPEEPPTPVSEGFESGRLDESHWVNYGGWSVTSEKPHSGTYAARCAENGGSLKWSGFLAAGEVSFWAYIGAAGCLEFSINGIMEYERAGGEAWEQVVVPVRQGTNNLRWEGRGPLFVDDLCVPEP